MKAIIFVDEEFDDVEVTYPTLRLKEAGFVIDIASQDGREKFGKKGTSAGVNRDFQNLNPDNYDVVIIPGGYRSPDRLRTYDALLSFLRAMDSKKKLIASICHGPWVLISAGILKGRKVTGHRGVKDDLINAGAQYVEIDTVMEGNLVTASHPRHVEVFMDMVLQQLNIKHS